MSQGNNPPENQEAINKQDKIQAITGASSMIETDRMQVKDGQMMIYNAMGKNNDNSVSMKDAKCPCPSSPVIHEINTNWSHLIEPIFSNDDTNTTFLTTAGTENNENMCVNTSSEPVALTNLTYKNPISDVTSVSNVQVNPMEIQSDSMMSKAASAAMSADIFANLSPAMEHGGSDCKTSPNDFEQDGVINKNMQLSIEDEIIEIGKSFSHTLNIVSTDSTSESSPDNILPHCKNNHKYKNKGQNKVYNKYEGERFKSQFLLPDTTGNIQDGESKTKAIRAKEFDSHARRNRRGKFPKAREFHNRCQKNNNQDNHKSERTEERIHRFRKETGKAAVNLRSRQLKLKASFHITTLVTVFCILCHKVLMQFKWYRYRAAAHHLRLQFLGIWHEINKINALWAYHVCHVPPTTVLNSVLEIYTKVVMQISCLHILIQ